MVDSERLIIVIESFPCIWNTQLNEYHNKNLKDLSWNNVCQEVIDDWHLLSKGERAIKFNDIKKRWNNIRDYYKKELQIQKNASTGQPSKKRKKYVFSDMLEFLRPVFEHKNSDKSEEIKHEPTNDTVTTTVTATLPTMTSTPPPQPVPPRPVTTTPAKLNAFETAIIKTLENKSNLPTYDDPDLLFLKSLLPDFKELTGSQKVDFKIGVLQLLRTFKNSGHSSVLDNDYKPNFLQNMHDNPSTGTDYAPMAANSPTSTGNRSPTPTDPDSPEIYLSLNSTHNNTDCNNSSEAIYIVSSNTDTQFVNDDELKDESDPE